MTESTKAGMDPFYKEEISSLDGQVQDTLDNFAIEIEQQQILHQFKLSLANEVDYIKVDLDDVKNQFNISTIKEV